MGATIADLADRDNQIRPFVKFVRESVENVTESLKAGHYVGQDVDFAHITPPYTRDIVKKKVEAWFKQIEADVGAGRMPKDWYYDYREQYNAFKEGREAPVNGAAIKDWGMIGPSDRERLLSLKIFTVEALAAINDEGKRRLGMGASDLQNKAISWLKVNQKSGKVASEMAKLKRDNEILQASVDNLETKLAESIKRIESLTSLLETQSSLAKQPVPDIDITLDD